MKKISVLPSLVFSTVCLFGLMTFPVKAQLPGTLSNGLVAYYTLDGNANDDSGNQVNGVAVGGLTPTLNRFGNSSGALSFNGVDQTIAAPDQNFVRVNNSFTLSLWVKPTSSESIEPETISGTSYSHSYAIFGVQGGSSSGFNVAVGTNGVSVIEHGDAFLPVVLSHAISITDWTMITLIVSNNDAPSLFVNGTYAHTGLNSQRMKIGSVFAGDNYQGIGGGGYGRYTGSLDDIMLYDRALAPLEVADLYQVQSVPEPSTYALLLFGGAASLYALRRRKS